MAAIYVAWPSDSREPLAEYLKNFGLEIQAIETTGDKPAFDEDDSISLWRDDGWQVVSTISPTVGDGHVEKFAFLTIEWEWKSPADYLSYALYLGDCSSGSRIEVKKGRLQYALGNIRGLGQEPERLYALYHKHQHGFWERFYEKSYLSAVRSVRLPVKIFMHCLSPPASQPFPEEFLVCTDGRETLRSTGLPALFYPHPQGIRYRVRFEAL